MSVWGDSEKGRKGEKGRKLRNLGANNDAAEYLKVTQKHGNTRKGAVYHRIYIWGPYGGPRALLASLAKNRAN